MEHHYYDPGENPISQSAINGARLAPCLHELRTQCNGTVGGIPSKASSEDMGTQTPNFKPSIQVTESNPQSDRK